MVVCPPPPTARDEDEPPIPFPLVEDHPARPSSSLSSHVDALGLPEVPAVALLRVAIAGVVDEKQ